MQGIDPRKRKSCLEASSDFLSRHTAALPNTRALTLLLKPSGTAAADAGFARRWHSAHEIPLRKLQFSFTVDTFLSALFLLLFNLNKTKRQNILKIHDSLHPRSKIDVFRGQKMTELITLSCSAVQHLSKTCHNLA